MLSNIGRAAIRRVGAGSGSTSTNNLLRGICQLHNVNGSQNTHDTTIRTHVSLPLRRLYSAAATATKPKTSAAKAETTTKPKAKKAAPKKTGVKKPAAKKPKKVVKKKAVKKVAKKPKPVLTEEQVKRKQIKILETLTLSPPKAKLVTIRHIIMKEISEQDGGIKGGLAKYGQDVSARKDSLTPEELERYNQTIKQNVIENEKAFKQWIETYTPDQIRIANNARRMLVSKTGKNRWPQLKDHRVPKRPAQAHIQFAADRWASGDFKGVKFGDASVLITKEWHALSDAAKQEYQIPVAREFEEHKAKVDKLFPALAERRSTVVKPKKAAA